MAATWRGYPNIPLITSGLLGNDLIPTTTFWKAFPFAVIYATTPSATYTANSATARFEVFPWNEGNTGGGADYFSWFNGSSTYIDLMSTLATYYGSVNVGKYASEWESIVGINGNAPYESVYFPKYVQALDNSTPISYSTLPLDYYAPGSGFFMLRKAWDTTSPVAKLQLNTFHRSITSRQTAERGRCGEADVGCRGRRQDTEKIS